MMPKMPLGISLLFERRHSSGKRCTARSGQRTFEISSTVQVWQKPNPNSRRQIPSSHEQFPHDKHCLWCVGDQKQLTSPWSSTLSLHPNSRGEAPIHRGMEHNFFRRRSHPAAASTRLFGSILPVGSKSPSAARRLILFHSKGFGGSCDLFDQRARFYCWVLYLRNFFFFSCCC